VRLWLYRGPQKPLFASSGGHEWRSSARPVVRHPDHHRLLRWVSGILDPSPIAPAQSTAEPCAVPDPIRHPPPRVQKLRRPRRRPSPERHPALPSTRPASFQTAQGIEDGSSETPTNPPAVYVASCPTVGGPRHPIRAPAGASEPRSHIRWRVCFENGAGPSTETRGTSASPIIGREAPHHLSLGMTASILWSAGISQAGFAGESRGRAGSKEDSHRYPVLCAPRPRASETPRSPPRPAVVSYIYVGVSVQEKYGVFGRTAVSTGEHRGEELPSAIA